MIYFDNSDATRVHPEALEAMLPWLTEMWGNPSSIHDLGMTAKRELDAARGALAGCIGADASEIVFTSGATESNNLALLGAARARPQRMHVVVSAVEHGSVMNAAKRLAREGCRLTIVPVDGRGRLPLDALKDAVDDETCIVSVIHADGEVGAVQDLEAVAEIAHSKGAWMHTDAAQTLGKLEVDVKAAGVDLASFNSHKLHGPMGVGALFTRRKTRPQRVFEGDDREFKLRPGTPNLPGIVGFARAARVAVRDRSQIERDLRDMVSALAEGLLTIPDSRLNGPPITDRLPGNLSLSFKFIEGEAAVMYLNQRGIYLSTGSACSAGESPSSVLQAIGLPDDLVRGSMRFTLSRFNTSEEVGEVIRHTTAGVELLRSVSPMAGVERGEKAGESENVN